MGNSNVLKILICILIIIFFANLLKNNIDKRILADTENRKMNLLKEQGYVLTPLDQSTIDFLKRNKYYQTDKKLVIYFNLTYFNTPGKNDFTNTFNNYKNSTEWSNKYEFIEYKINHLINLNTQNGQELAEISEKCNPFCVINLKTNTGYFGNCHDKNKLYSALYAFYNE